MIKHVTPKKIYDFDKFKRLVFEKLLHDCEFLTVKVKSYAPMNIFYNVKFEADSIYGYRCFDEGQLEEYFATFESRFHCGVYKTSDSKFLEWANNENPFKKLPDTVAHYLIVTVNEVIEILSFDDPVIAETKPKNGSN